MNANAPAPGPAHASLLSRLWREPLVHFLLIGLALFLVYGVRRPAPAASEAKQQTIEISDDDLRQLAGLWEAQWQRPPTPEELRKLVDDQVREEIYFRQALAEGLDKEDILVRRRLVDRMIFLSETEKKAPDPTPEALRAWFDANPELFAVPKDLTFRQVFFSNQTRPNRAKEDAILARDSLRGKAADAPEIAAMGDPSDFAPAYQAMPPQQAAAIFGQTFADGLLGLPSGSWQGPLESPTGWHLVYVEAITPGPVPPFELIVADVRERWRAVQREAAREKAFAAMQARYRIILPRSLDQKEAAPLPASAQATP